MDGGEVGGGRSEGFKLFDSKRFIRWSMCETNSKKQDNRQNFTLYGIILFSVIILFWYNWASIIYAFKLDWIERVNYAPLEVLFGGLAFSAFLIALYMQKEELALQRRELEDTRKVLNDQKDQLSLQNNSIATQTFENTLFQILTVHNEILNSIIMKKSGNNITSDSGRQALTVLRDEFVSLSSVAKTDDDVVTVYENWYRNKDVYLGGYFRTLYNIFKLIDQGSVQDKKKYANLVRAQVSDQEMYLLFINCISRYGSKKFKPLIEKYSVFKNIELSKFKFSKEIADKLRERYTACAFGDCGQEDTGVRGLSDDA